LRGALYYKHALQLPDSKSAASAIGFAIHDVIANTLRAKHEDDELPPLETAMEFYNDHASTLLVDALKKPGANADAEREAGSGAFRAWYRSYAPGVQVASDEHGPLIERSMAGKITGILVNTVIDLVDRIRGVVDWKSAGRKPTGISNHARFQLTTYAAIARQTHGELVTITKTKIPGLYPMHFTPTWADIKYAEKIYPQVALGSRSGLYPPRRGNFLCSRSRCAYWRECEPSMAAESPTERPEPESEEDLLLRASATFWVRLAADRAGLGHVRDVRETRENA